MKHIIIFQQKEFMMQRIKHVLSGALYTIHEAKTILDLENILAHDLIKVDMIIAELDFDKKQEIQMINNYLHSYPETKLIIFTNDMSRQTFLDSINVGAKDYIIHTVKDNELKDRLDRHLTSDVENLVPTHLILDLNKYISGEMIKANKGNYELTIVFSTIRNEKGLHILKEDTSKLGEFFSNMYWDTDSVVIYGYNHLLSFFPFCRKDMVETLEKKLHHMFAQFKAYNMHLAKCEMHNTFVTFPDEGLTVDDIIRIVRRKIESNVIKKQPM